MPRLNYHHLFYFWRVAKGKNLTQVARELHVSQSALSMQIKQLEEQMGHPLFRREGRQLHLTEPGRIALEYAEEIFNKGEELRAFMRDHSTGHTRQLRIGAVATLSRNFLEAFIRPLLPQEDIRLSLRSAGLDELLKELAEHNLDLVLSNIPVIADRERSWRSQRIARQAVSVIGHPDKRAQYTDIGDLAHQRLLVPGPHSEIRMAFELVCQQWQIQPKIMAEVDDMAMLRLLARDTQCLAILPGVVVKDEIRKGELIELGQLTDVHENFYAVTIRRQFQLPIVTELLKRGSEDILAVS
ncbi:LysR family transcriptional regulator [Lacimicrobium alkaliphilum]|uniref:LysR family transcriptional regulator n=1 Tax=Lacimicrobium alkaliphilum TaxID=1526571 RepID=A0A0U2PHA3_9ALTE|nr:LysR family transcriptional regulator [Lacimicrobium alkaliphilum]ALS98909.1 LysR family transcriptional regulator [Lacimicrobium alkaliphilum]